MDIKKIISNIRYPLLLAGFTWCIRWIQLIEKGCVSFFCHYVGIFCFFAILFPLSTDLCCCQLTIEKRNVKRKKWVNHYNNLDCCSMIFHVKGVAKSDWSLPSFCLGQPVSFIIKCSCIEQKDDNDVDIASKKWQPNTWQIVVVHCLVSCQLSWSTATLSFWRTLEKKKLRK